MNEFKPIVHGEPIALRLARQILDRIKSGAFPLGTKLPSEVELARQFEVSRPSIREALGALQFSGYIDSVRGSGKRIVSIEGRINSAGPTPQAVAPGAILDLFGARLLIEPQVAALAAMDPDQRKLALAETLVDGMNLAVAEPELHVESDLRVHRAIAQVCQNSFMQKAALRLLDIAASPALRAARERAWSDHALPHLWGLHQSTLLQAIRAEDPASAAETAWTHLASSTENLLAVLIRDEAVDGASINRMNDLLGRGPSCFFAGTIGSPAASDASRSRDLTYLQKGTVH